MQSSFLRRFVAAEGGSIAADKVTIPTEMFHRLLTGALQAKAGFDEQYYLAANPDVRDAVKKKLIESGAEHYFITGYLEDRLPRRIVVDEGFYLENNPDVAAAIRAGTIKNAQMHFEASGFKEGRVPHRNFSLF